MKYPVMLLSVLCAVSAFAAERDDDYTVASYYFPNYHVDARNEAFHGKGWTEWELVKKAVPRFDGHHQPNVPLWGYTDEADPRDMAQKIDAAADHGVDTFIFDWYWYDDGPFLQRGLEDGFMKATNNDRMKFGLMWANHDWVDIHPATLGKPYDLLYPGRIKPETFDTIIDYVIENYFKHPSYWKIDGAPYFSIYELHTFMKSFGGKEGARAALLKFREKVKAAGFPDLHLNGVIWGVQILPSETTLKNPAELIDYLKLDSTTSYVWIHHVGFPTFPETPYRYVQEKYVDYYRGTAKTYPIPNHPNVTMGWDSSPRTNPDGPFINKGYPYMGRMKDNTPKAFRGALEEAKKLAEDLPESQRIITINCWNEWTEGSYLEPDTVNKYGYLEAIRDVFGNK
jgi:hypothetical protein